MDRTCYDAPVVTDRLRALAAIDPTGAWLGRLYEPLEEVHWGAVRAPGTLIAGPSRRDVTLVDGPFTLPCVIETETSFVAFEDATQTPLATGTSADPRRHHLSRCIEALRTLARERRVAEGLDTDPLFGVIVIGGPDVVEPHRTTILEGLPHIEREQAEDLYASFWGRLEPAVLDAVVASAAAIATTNAHITRK